MEPNGLTSALPTHAGARRIPQGCFIAAMISISVMTHVLVHTRMGVRAGRVITLHATVQRAHA